MSIALRCYEICSRFVATHNAYKSFGNDVSSLTEQLSRFDDALSRIVNSEDSCSAREVSPIADPTIRFNQKQLIWNSGEVQEAEEIPGGNVRQEAEIPWNIIQIEMDGRVDAGYACPPFTLVRHRARIR